MLFIEGGKKGVQYVFKRAVKAAGIKNVRHNNKIYYS
jgi:hypothetical protein